MEQSIISYDSIAAMFNKRIADLVFFLSEDKSKSWKERKQHTLTELSIADDGGIKIVCLADKLASMRAISRDHHILGDSLWERFNVPDKNEQGWYYKGLCGCLASMEIYQPYQESKALTNEVFNT